MHRGGTLRTALVGSKAIGLSVARRLAELSDLREVITLGDATDDRSQLDGFRELHAQVVRSRREADHAIRALDVDLVVVAGWYWILPADVVGKRPFVGIHHSLLPSYRGGSPLVWQLINGEREVGTSLFTLTDEMDAGPLWGQSRVEAGEGYIGDVLERCDAAALELLPCLFNGTWPIPQPAGASWCAQRSPNDGLIDWNKPAVEIVRWIRAQSRPYPGAFAYCGPHKVTIWRASVSQDRWYGSPGQVVGNRVMCGDGAVVIEEASERPSGRLKATPTVDRIV